MLNTKNVPWDTESAPLDMLYHGTHSGKKKISYLVETLLDEDTEMLSETNLSLICDSIIAMFGLNWEKLYNTLSLEYNPLNNYDMTENETTNGTDTLTRTGTDTTARTGTTTDTHTGTDNRSTSQTTDNDATTSNSAYGYNSSNAVPTDTHTGTTDASTVGTDNEIVNLQDETTHNTTDTNTKNLTDNGEHETIRTLTRSGNIGVTSSMDLINAERGLWVWRFFEQVFNDLDTVLTIQIY